MIQAFEDIMQVDDRTLQEWLGATNVSQLCTAMHGTNDEVRTKIQRNLSSLGRQALQVEMETVHDLTPIRIERSKDILAQGLDSFLEQREERTGGPGPAQGPAPSLQLGDTLPGTLVEFFTTAARKVRRYGLVSLEDDLPRIQDEFLREGIRLIAANANPDLVRDVLQTRIAVLEADHRRATREARERLERSGDDLKLAEQLQTEDSWLEDVVLGYEMVLEGCLCIQAFENPVAVRLKLESFFGGGLSVGGYQKPEDA